MAKLKVGDAVRITDIGTFNEEVVSVGDTGTVEVVSWLWDSDILIDFNGETQHTDMNWDYVEKVENND